MQGQDVALSTILKSFYYLRKEVVLMAQLAGNNLTMSKRPNH
jgi:hypothetical protein